MPASDDQTPFHKVVLPECDGIADDAGNVLARVWGWASSAPLHDLVQRFGGRIPDGDGDAVLEYLEQFSAMHWDFRAGGERADARRQVFTPETAAAIDAAAHALGLTSTVAPRRVEYSHVLVLGGLLRACLQRTEYAAQLLANHVRASQVSAVGGYRRLTSAEREVAAEFGVDECRFEVDVMAEGLRRAFSAEPAASDARGGDPEVDPNRAWQVRHFTSPDFIALRAVAAPSSEPERRRANTSDTCRFWAGEVAKLQPGDAVLVVTSTAYVPFQHCDVVADVGLPYGCAVDTVGVDTAAPTSIQAGRRHAGGALLQEIRSAVRSMRRLAAVAQETWSAPSRRGDSVSGR